MKLWWEDLQHPAVLEAGSKALWNQEPVWYGGSAHSPISTALTEATEKTPTDRNASLKWQDRTEERRKESTVLKRTAHQWRYFLYLSVCTDVCNWRRKVLIAFRVKCQDVFWKALKCFDKFWSTSRGGLGFLHRLTWCQEYLCNVKVDCILKRHLGLHWLDCHFHANRLLKAEFY